MRTVMPEKVDRLMARVEMRIWGSPDGRPPVIWPLCLLMAFFVFDNLQGMLHPALGSLWGGLVALLYGMGAWGLLIGTRAWSTGWARRWQARGFGTSREFRRLPGISGFQLLVMGLPMFAMWPLIHWAHIEKSVGWYAWGFGVLCMMLLWENAARGLVPLLQDARSQALRAKLAPHFIFNALNTLKAQIPNDPAGAEATADRLAQLFRQVVTVPDEPRIPLKDELAFVEAYLGIERARFGERLKVRVDVPEELESVGIPPLSVQVLVENAVKHGIAPLERGGEIRISAKREGADLLIEVSDPGTGLGVERGTGTALETLRARLSAPGDLRLARVEGRTVASFRWRQP